ncbi:MULTISPECIES: hypothetical protein [Flavobacterium]|uniref:hypothetical protein n=1 Tax=Flavobacterium TaxID=237 RepID=UPI0011834FC4|nr:MULTISPECIES: hypothetical protein [Flavobacterium]MCR4033589.1 hypothetical protein [Flavobacterium panacis]
MKKLLLIAFLLLQSFVFAQVNPTLAVGLEKLTMNKGTIDVEVLTEIIMSKQKELKQEALKRFMFKMFPEANFTTKYYVQNCLNVLLNEKNPQVIEKEILELTTNYALSLGVTYAIIKSNDKELINANKAYCNYKIQSPFYQEKTIKEKADELKRKKSRDNWEELIKTHEKDFNTGLVNIDKITNEKDLDKLVYKKSKATKYKKKLARLTLRKDISSTNSTIIEDNKIGSEKIIKNLSNNTDFIKLDSASVTLSVMQKYITTHPKDKSIISLYSSLKDLNNSFSELNTLSKNKTKPIDESSLKSTVEEKLFFLKKQYSRDPLEIPFGILLDVVSLSLSDIPELQKKGFFKNQIDYRSGQFYSSLKNDEIEKKFRESLDDLKINICKKIRPYVQNYDIINEFLKKNKGKTVLDIKKNLQDISVNYLIQMINEKSDTPDLKIKNTLDEIAVLENSITLINYNTIAKTPKKISIPSLDCNICDKITAYKESLTYQKSLESFNSSTTNIDSDIKKLTNDLIKLNPVKLFEFPDKQLSKLIALENSSLDPFKANINSSIIKLNSKIDILPDFAKKYKNNLVIEILNDAIKLKEYIVYQYPDDKLSAINEIKINNLIDDNYFNVDSSKFNDDINKIEELKKTLITEIDKKNVARKNIEKDIKSQINDKYLVITQSDDFYNRYLTSILEEAKIDSFKTVNLDSITISKASKILSNLHSKIKSLINNNDVQMSDIVYLDNYINEKMVELKIRDRDNDEVYNSIIKQNKIIIPLLKIRALQKINEIIEYDDELMNLFEFIANLNKLDEAETYQSIVNLLRDGSKKIEDNLPDGEFKDSYTLFINAIKKYTLINPSEEYVEIDVASFLTELQQYYDRNNKSVFSLYLSLGLNQNFFFKNFKFSDGEEIKNISFASEKIGVKWRIANFKRFEGYENVIKNDVYLNKKAPFINEFYGIVYGAGLLYTLANTTTNQNFDFPHIGAGLGLRFYNALDVNLILGFPFVKDAKFGDNAFWGIGLDIPLGEYLQKLGNKK